MARFLFDVIAADVSARFVSDVHEIALGFPGNDDLVLRVLTSDYEVRLLRLLPTIDIRDPLLRGALEDAVARSRTTR